MMSKSLRVSQLGLLSLLLSWASGCIHLEQTIDITGRNSGNFTINFAIPIELYETLAEDQYGADVRLLSRYFDPNFGPTIYSEVNGIRLNQYRVYQRRDNMNVLIKGDILDLRKALGSKALGDFSLSNTDNGASLLTMNLPIPRNLNRQKGSQFTAAERAERELQLKEMITGLRLSLKIIVPNTVISTSAPVQEKQSARWLFDPENDDQFLSNPPELFVEYR